MPIPADQLEIITITLIVWFSLVILSIYHLRNIPVASKHSEIPKLMVLALSVAGAFTLGVTVFVYAYFPQFLQSASTASIVVAGFIGAGISIWWTSATFWRELTALAQPISPKPDLNQSQLIVAEVPDIWNLMILYALNEKEQLKLSEIAQQAGMTTLTTQRRVNDMVDKGLTVKFCG